jgi:LysR family transcriptional regulator, regulator for bpeEF and oprC
LVFLSVVESRSFSEAARALGVTTSAVSAAVQRLEQKLSVRLLERTTRRVGPTAEGREFYQRCKRIVADLEQAEISVAGAARLPSGRLRIGMPAALARLCVVPHLPEFTRAYPSVSLEIVVEDFLPAPSRAGLDAIIHIGELPSSSMIVRKLASVDYVICAAPQYLAAHGTPQTPADLAAHTCLRYRRPRNGQIRTWRFSNEETPELPSPTKSLVMNSGDALVAAAKAGLGLAQVAEYYARPDLRNGSLVEVLADQRAHAHHVSVVFQQRKRIAPRLRVFIDFLVETFETPAWRA